MNLIKIIDDNGLLIGEDLPEQIPYYPYLTKEVNDTVTNEDGTVTMIETTHTEIVAETVTENVETQEWNEELQDYETVVTPVISEVPVTNPHYIETPCLEGFYHPKWDFTNQVWVEGGQAPTESPAQEIARLKIELSSLDYQVLKCIEYLADGKDEPYDYAALRAERQTMRDRINELEQLMSSQELQA